MKESASDAIKDVEELIIIRMLKEHLTKREDELKKTSDSKIGKTKLSEVRQKGMKRSLDVLISCCVFQMQRKTPIEPQSIKNYMKYNRP